MTKIQAIALTVMILISNVSCESLKSFKGSSDQNGTKIEVELLPQDPLFINEEIMGP